MTLQYKHRSFNIDTELAREYERKVRLLDGDGIEYIFIAFDLDILSTGLETEFTNALKEELDIAAHLPKALEKALKDGLFD